MNEITHETLDNIIIEAINTICCKTKETNLNSVFEYLNKELHNSNITFTRLSTVTINGKLEIKYLLGKADYWVKGNNALESCKSKTPTSSPSLPFRFQYETPLIESNKYTVRDTYRSLEEKVNLINLEVIAMKYFVEDQILMLRQSRKIQLCKNHPATTTLKLLD